MYAPAVAAAGRIDPRARVASPPAVERQHRDHLARVRLGGARGRRRAVHMPRHGQPRRRVADGQRDVRRATASPAISRHACSPMACSRSASWRFAGVHEHPRARGRHILLVNRVQPHTGPRTLRVVCQDLLHGLGQATRAQTIHATARAAGRAHAAGARCMSRHRQVLALGRPKTPSTDGRGGLARTYQVAGLAKRTAAARPGPDGALPFDEIDVLIGDDMGRNISGTAWTRTSGSHVRARRAEPAPAHHRVVCSI